MKVSYLGPDGSYSSLAVLLVHFFLDPAQRLMTLFKLLAVVFTD